MLMKKVSITVYFTFTVLLFLTIILLFGVACENGAVEDGTITLTFSLPETIEDLDSASPEVIPFVNIEGTGTLTIEGGAPTEYNLTFKSIYIPFDAMGPLAESPYHAQRVLLTITGTRDGSGLFDRITDLTFERQAFALEDIEDPIPEFDSESREYRKELIEATWDENGLRKMVNSSGDPPEIQSTTEYDYQNGSLYAYREAEGNGDYFSNGFHFIYGTPAPFQQLPSEIREYLAIPEDPSIPPLYPYERNPNFYELIEIFGYRYTADAGGRIGEFITQYGGPAMDMAIAAEVSLEDDERYVFSYDDEGRISAIDYYVFDLYMMGWVYLLRTDVTYSDGMPGIPFEELFIGPWGRGIFPFMMGPVAIAM
jgi:hypothetical protein